MNEPQRVVPDDMPVLPLALALLHTKLNAQARQVLGQCSDRLAALGAEPLTLPQWRIVRLIGLGIATNSTEVRKRAAIDKGQFSRTLDVLIERGIVAATIYPEDQRQWGLSLSDHGKAVYLCIAPGLKARHRHLTTAISESEYSVLLGALDKLCIAADDYIDISDLSD